jgi:hypothetical protein
VDLKKRAGSVGLATDCSPGFGESSERTGFREPSHCLSIFPEACSKSGRFREVKNALLLLADISGVFEKLLLKNFPDGGRSKPDKPCIGRHPEKGC